MGAAVWVHAVAALPWVVLLVGQGLCWVERELEEDASTFLSPFGVFWRVTLPRCRAAIFAAGIWVALMTATEITVTDMMQVRTFGEEVYTQLVAGDDTAVARAVAVSVPMILLSTIVVLWGTHTWERNLPPSAMLPMPALVFRLGRTRRPLLVFTLATTAFLVALPLGSLIWKAGVGGSPAAWSPAVAYSHLRYVFHARSLMIGASLLLAMLSGAVAAGLGLLCCWLARGSRWFQTGLLGLIAVLWSMPAPILGLGLKDMIGSILDLDLSAHLAVALYYGPSPLPLLWVHVMRFFPIAVAMLWPVLRLIPREILEAARVDGVQPRQELWYVVLPLAAPACLRAGLAVGVLSLGEISAGKLVETPGFQPFAHEVFTQMHYGVSNDLAALCLILLAMVTVGGALVALGKVDRRKEQTRSIE
jgi:iron(III) transport system permease protein